MAASEDAQPRHLAQRSQSYASALVPKESRRSDVAKSRSRYSLRGDASRARGAISESSEASADGGDAVVANEDKPLAESSSQASIPSDGEPRDDLVRSVPPSAKTATAGSRTTRVREDKDGSAQAGDATPDAKTATTAKPDAKTVVGAAATHTPAVTSAKKPSLRSNPNRSLKAKKNSDVRFALPHQQQSLADDRGTAERRTWTTTRLQEVIDATRKDGAVTRSRLKALKEEVDTLGGISKLLEADVDSMEATLMAMQDDVEKQKAVTEKLLFADEATKRRREDELSVRLDCLEKDQTKMFRFQLLVMLSLAVLTFWCCWRAQDSDSRRFESRR